MFNEYLNTHSNEEIIKAIEDAKKLDFNAPYWRELQIAYMTNNFSLNYNYLTIKQIKGYYYVVFNKIPIIYEDFLKLVSDTKSDEEFYMNCLKYLSKLTPHVNELKIQTLEQRLEEGKLTIQEQQIIRKKHVFNTLTKIGIVLIFILAILFIVRMLGTMFVSQ